jgi:large conductance mechanosensitive channel
MLKDFKNFILRGNVVDLAVGIVIGSAFTSVVKSLVSDMITPLIGAVYKSKNFGNASFKFHHSTFMYGDFVNACISFLVVALVVFFFVVRPINKLTELARRRRPDPASTTRACPECLSSIPKASTRCMYCTVKVK